jgi:hypothetical protein
MAVTTPAHALLQIVLVQEVTPIVPAELTVRMHHHRILGLPAPDGHQERVHFQHTINARAHRPANHLAREQVEYHGQI